MSAPKIKCRICNGKGEVELSPEMITSYLALRKLGPSKICDLAKALNLELTNAHHRVRRLVKLGVVKKFPDSSPGIYFAEPYGSIQS